MREVSETSKRNDSQGFQVGFTLSTSSFMSVTAVSDLHVCMFHCSRQHKEKRVSLCIRLALSPPLDLRDGKIVANPDAIDVPFQCLAKHETTSKLSFDSIHKQSTMD
jgi:hypothetical protein